MLCLLKGGKLIELCGMMRPDVKVDQFFCLTINITFLDLNSDKRCQEAVGTVLFVYMNYFLTWNDSYSLNEFNIFPVKTVVSAHEL